MESDSTPKPRAYEEFRRFDRDAVRQVNAATRRYLRLARNESKKSPNHHRAEYVGDQMVSLIVGESLKRYLTDVLLGRINAGHGYDEDIITRTVLEEIREKTGVEKAIIVPTGSAANLCLISSFVASSEYRADLKFIACESEHSVKFEDGMLESAGIVPENMILLPSREKFDGILDIETLAGALEGIGPNFIFQMAIPTVEGVVPPLDEFKAMIALVKQHGGKFLLDGARMTNALVYWGLELGDLKNLGINGFTLGTSKKGGVAEVAGIYDDRAADLLARKAAGFGHTHSKQSVFSLPTGIFLNTDYWKIEAASENQSARVFADAVEDMGIKPYYEVNSNMVFIKLPPDVLEKLATHPEFGGVYSDYGRDGDISRIVFTGFQTTESLDAMIAALKEALAKNGSGDPLADVNAHLTNLIAGRTNTQ